MEVINMTKLEVGEKYLSISILGSIKVSAFKNKNKQNDKSPDYTGNGVAIWVNTKKEDIQVERVDDI